MSRQDGTVDHQPRILVLPWRDWLADAVREGGGVAVDEGPADAVVWTDPRDPAGLRQLLDDQPELRWVQLPWAGIEPYVPVLDHDRVWTCGKGVYADPVAEQALMFALAGLRGMGTYARAQTWEGPRGVNLLGARVVVVGGGGIARSLLRLLEPFGCRTTVVRRRAEDVAGVSRTVTSGELDDVVGDADAVFLTMALTPETEGLFDERRLRLLQPHAWLVNVARGRHVVTDDLVRVLEDGAIGGAGLDVTDPEPLPGDHPLWDLENCLLTPHTGGHTPRHWDRLADIVADNVVALDGDGELRNVVAGPADD